MMSTLCAFLSIFLWIAPVLSHCPDGWIHHGYSCYHFSHDTETMLDASYACRAMGGELVNVQTAAENHYLYTRVNSLNVGHFWIGANDIQEESIWRWFGSNAKVRYTNWAPGQPQNTGKDENCAVLTKQDHGKWHDYPCHRLMHFICEKHRCYDC